ncbi:MAG: hypothetical protein GF364_16330 [Candidatus Lokiarchaeota archaeon]|nr:hypothetical protein [Candidatus Lokiarchaeota archaeon]
MSDEKKKYGIGMKQVKYIGSCGRCPACGSRDVKFSLPFEAHLRTVDGKLSKVVLDFRNPQYWLNTTMTKCANCSFEFHLRDVVDDFYKGLEASKQDSGENPAVWSYEFDNFKVEKEE